MRSDEGVSTVNAYTAGGLFVGIVLGFFLGRWWAEYFRYRWQAQQAYNQMKAYQGSGAAWAAGLALIIGGLIVFTFAAGPGF